MPEKSALDAIREEIRSHAPALAEARRELEKERREMKKLVLDAIDAGMAELEASKLSGMTRDSIRSWLGK